MFAQAKYHNRFNEKFSLQAIGKFDYSWSKYQDFHSRHENGVQTDVYTQREYYISTVGLYKPMDYLSFSLAEDFFVNTLDATIPKCPFPERYTTLTNLSAQYSDPRLTLTASLLSTYAKEKVEMGESADDKKRLSPAASVSYRLLDDNTLRIRASYKDGFRLPTFNDLYYDRFGDKNLKPEKASQYNLGLTWSGASDKLSLEYASITADGYFNRVKDKIVAIPTMFIWKMMNMGTVNIGGVDLSISSRFRITQVINMGVDGNYSYQHAVDKSDRSSKSFNNQIPYTPRHTGNVSLSIENPWVNLSWTINMVGERYSLAENIKSNMIERYAEQQISANRSFSVGKVLMRLQAEVLNLTNKQYEVIKYYPMPGRSFRASVRMTY
jgi:outer membrane receptor protein involved in Fe transport